MNELEPWRIWAVTGVLAALIVGSAILRVRPLDIGVTAAQASTLTADQRTSTQTSEPARYVDQDDGYFVGFTHSAFEPTSVTSTQAYNSDPVIGALYSSALLSSALNNDDQEPELDVTKQLTGEEDSQHVLADSISTGELDNGVVGWLADNYDEPQDGPNWNAPSVDSWVYPATTGLVATVDGVNWSVDSNAVVQDVSGSNVVRILKVALADGTVQTTVTGTGYGANGVVFSSNTNASNVVTVFNVAGSVSTQDTVQGDYTVQSTTADGEALFAARQEQEAVLQQAAASAQSAWNDDNEEDQRL